jgi:hypothetical protein
MSMIFPGMDPYLEDPQIWHGVHNSLIVYIRDHLQPLLRPRYIAALEDRVFVEGPDREIIPDVWLRRSNGRSGGQAAVLATGNAPVIVEAHELEIHETYIEILDRQSGQRVVTTLEVVSPTNKYAGHGRALYVDKQREVRASPVHLVEIDLLRTGPHVLAVPEWLARSQGDYDYLICVNRAVGRRTKFELYPCALRQPLPPIRVPLAEGDPDVILDLQAVLAHTYEAGSYRDRLNYGAPGVPPLAPEDQEWASQRIQQARQQA